MIRELLANLKKSALLVSAAKNARLEQRVKELEADLAMATTRVGLLRENLKAADAEIRDLRDAMRTDDP